MEHDNMSTEPQISLEIEDYPETAVAGNDVTVTADCDITNYSDYAGSMTPKPEPVMMIGYLPEGGSRVIKVTEETLNYEITSSDEVTTTFQMPNERIELVVAVFYGSHYGTEGDRIDDVVKTIELGGPDLSVIEVEIYPANPTTQDQVTVHPTVKNTGDAAGDLDVDVTIDGGRFDERDNPVEFTDVGPGVTRTKTGPTHSPLSVGNHRVACNGLSGIFTVTEPTHNDTHNDHSDTHSDTHNDHSDTHNDTHSDTHNDHSDTHNDTHSDAHSDEGFFSMRNIAIGTGITAASVLGKELLD